MRGVFATLFSKICLMSSILYYSNYCDKCKILLQNIAKSPSKKDMHFICIDNRVKRDGRTNIILQNGQEILLPPTVNKVPALLLLNKSNHVLFGTDINQYLQPQIVASQNAATKNNGEPLAFSLSGQGYGVASDNYSFLDQDPTDLTAKGNGGMRQQHHYATLNHTDNIETPPEGYKADTIGNTMGELSVEKLMEQRNNDMKQIATVRR